MKLIKFRVPGALPLLGGLLCSSALTAQITLVDFGNSTDYVTDNIALQGHTTSGKAFDLATPYSPASGYSTPAGKSGTFYGASSITQSNNGTGSWGTAGASMRNNVTSPAYNLDALGLYPTWSGTSGDSSQRFNFIAVFQKGDFLNGGDAATVSFDSASSFSIRYSVSFGYHNPRLRILVQDGSDWFISSAYAPTDNSVIVNTSNVSFVNDRTWSSFDPAGNLSSIGAAATPTFADVNAVGIWWQVGSKAGNNGGTNGRVLVGSFSVDGAVIPESSAFGLIGGLGALGFVALRRRRS